MLTKDERTKLSGCNSGTTTIAVTDDFYMSRSYMGQPTHIDDMRDPTMHAGSRDSAISMCMAR